MSYYQPTNAGESRAQLQLDHRDEVELDERIRVALGYMEPKRIAQCLGVTLYRVECVLQTTPYYRVKGLRDIVKCGVRRG